MKKRLISMLAVITMLATLVSVPVSVSADADVWDGTVATAYASGTGTEADPYIINTGAQLAYLAKSVNDATDGVAGGITAYGNYTAYKVLTGVYFKLGNDIDLNNVEWTPIGAYANRFNGSFDGNNKVIKNLKISTQHVGDGLFGSTGTNTVIKNLGIEVATISIAANDTISVGGVTVRNHGVGTLVGIIGGGTYTDCFVKTASLTNTGSSNQGMGGMFGSARPVDSGSIVTISDSYTNDVTISQTGGWSWNGGFIGQTSINQAADYIFNKLYITNCYAANPTVTQGFCAGFGVDSRRETFVVATNVFTTGTKYVNDNMGWNIGTSGLSKSSLKSAVLGVQDANFVNDNVSSPINNGFPVLEWEKTWETVEALYEMEFVEVHDESIKLITKNINLPATYSYNGEELPLIWTSTNTNVLSISDNVATVNMQLEDTDVILMATDDVYGSSRAFNLTVLGAFSRAFYESLNGQAVNNITQSISLPKSVSYGGESYPVSWTSSTSSAMDDEGTVGPVITDTPLTLVGYANGANHTYDVVVRRVAADDALFNEYIDFEQYELGADITKEEGWSNPNEKWGRALGVDYVIDRDPHNEQNKVLNASRFYYASQWNSELGKWEYLNTKTGATDTDGPAGADEALFLFKDTEGNPVTLTEGRYEVSTRFMFSNAAKQQIGIGIQGLSGTGNSMGNYIIFNVDSDSEVYWQHERDDHKQYFKPVRFIKRNVWYDLAFVVDLDKGKYEIKTGGDAYQGGISGDLVDHNGTALLKQLTGVSIWSSRGGNANNGETADWYIDDFMVKELTISDEQYASNDLSLINMPSRMNTNTALTTSGEYGSTISWTSLNPEIIAISEDGTTAIPKFKKAEQTAVLKATAAYGTGTVSKEYTIQVDGKQPYSVLTPEVVSGDTTGNVIVENGSVDAVKIVLNSVYTAGDKVIAALYNADGEFVDVAVQDVPSDIELNVATRVEFDNPITLPSDITGLDLRLYVWANDVTPLAEAYTSDAPDTALWIFGDSTLTNYVQASYPQQGWGKYVDSHLIERVTADYDTNNFAVGGYTVENYTGNTSLHNLASEMSKFKKGDYAIICLGINDRGIGMERFEKGLKNMIDILEGAEVSVILVTPCCSLGDTVESKSYDNSCEVVKRVAMERGLVCIDLNTAMSNYYIASGLTTTALKEKFFMCNVTTETWPGTIVGGRADDIVHLNERGAQFAAYLFAKELQNTTSGLAKYVKLDEAVRTEWDF